MTMANELHCIVIQFEDGEEIGIRNETGTSKEILI